LELKTIVSMKKIITLLGTVTCISILNAQAGNVGINTPTPTNTLTVNGNQSIGFRYQNVNAPTNGIIIEGNTGIGTSTPLSKLDVNGQTKIGDGTITPAAPPSSGSILELNSESRGLRLPQVALTSTTQYSPMQGSGTDFSSKGMTVFNYNATVASSNTLYPARGAGEYYWDGTGWVSKNSYGPQASDSYMSVYSTSNQDIAANTWTTINFTNKYYDKNNSVALPTSAFSIPNNSTGLYQINASYTTDINMSSIRRGRIGIFVNNILIKTFVYSNAYPSLPIETSGGTALYMQGGDVVTFKFYADGIGVKLATIHLDMYQVSR